MTVESIVNDNYKVFHKDKKSRELDIIKHIDELVAEYNKDPTNHYFLRLLKGVRRAWF